MGEDVGSIQVPILIQYFLREPRVIITLMKYTYANTAEDQEHRKKLGAFKIR